MEAALPHFHRLTSSRFYQQYAAPPVRISSNYLHDLIPQQHPTLLQQYLAYYNEPLVPLDLSLKSTTPITPPCTPPPLQKRKAVDDNKPDKSPKIFRHFEDNDSKEESQDKTDKRKLDDENSNDSDSPEVKKLKFTQQFFEELKTCLPQEEETTPSKSGRSSPDVVEIKDLEERPKKSPKPVQQPTKKSKAVRRLMFDEDKTSPVSGTIIRDLAEDETLVVRKVFNCPANLASHRRWHKPRVAGAVKRREPTAADSGRFPCQRCGKMFRRQAYLRKHMLAHEQPENEPEKEPSAFRQVHAEYPTYQPDVMRETGFNNFWNKIPAPQHELNWEGVRPRCGSSCSSEDSRSLDVTGSEDEGGGGGVMDG